MEDKKVVNEQSQTIKELNEQLGAQKKEVEQVKECLKKSVKEQHSLRNDCSKVLLKTKKVHAESTYI